MTYQGWKASQSFIVTTNLSQKYSVALALGLLALQDLWDLINWKANRRNDRWIDRFLEIAIFGLVTKKAHFSFSFFLSFLKSLKADRILYNLSTNHLDALFTIIGFQSVGHIRKMVGPYWLSCCGTHSQHSKTVHRWLILIPQDRRQTMVHKVSNILCTLDIDMHSNKILKVCHCNLTNCWLPPVRLVSN